METARGGSVNRYIRISTQFWHNSVLNNSERLLFLYTVTSPHSNTIGFYVLPKLYIMHDLKWSRQRFVKPFKALLELGLIKYCEKTSVILIPDFLKHNPIQNKNQAIAAIKFLRKIPYSFLHEDFRKCVERYAEQYKGLFEEFFAGRGGGYK